MLRALNRVLSTQSSFHIGVLSFLLVAIVGVFDFATGYELSISLFYTIPVGVASWWVGKRFGLVVCIISAVTWLAADLALERQYSHPTIPFWNASVRLGFFIIIALLSDRLRGVLELQALLARQDGLTGIMNARTFKQTCASVLELASRYSRPVAIGYLDLDGFKGVNDSLGHSAGDQVLKAVSTALTKQLRASDFVGRLGGDEFAILLPETDLAGAKTLFSGLRESLVDLAAQNHWPVGFSIGVAVFPLPTANPDTVIRYADDLMYKVKNSGKNGILYEEYAGVTLTDRGHGDSELLQE